MAVVHLVDVSPVNQSSTLTRTPWKLDAKHLEIRELKLNISLVISGPSHLGHELSVHGAEGDDPAGPAGQAHQQVAGGGRQRDAHCAALQTKQGND